MLRSAALVAFLSAFSVVAGCAASDGPDETGDDDVVARGPGARCTQTIAEQNHHVADLEARDGKLTIRESSTNGRFAPVSYSMSRVMLMAAPSGKPKYACGTGAAAIKVWEQFASVGSAYYKLGAAAQPEAPTVECSKVLEEKNQHTVTMSFDGDELSVVQTSTNGRFAPQKFALSRVMLAAEPSDEPVFECAKPGADITLWSSFARVNSSYYKVSPAR
jgi:hypothetical protein